MDGASAAATIAIGRIEVVTGLWIKDHPIATDPDPCVFDRTITPANDVAIICNAAEVVMAPRDLGEHAGRGSCLSSAVVPPALHGPIPANSTGGGAAESGESM